MRRKKIRLRVNCYFRTKANFVHQHFLIISPKKRVVLGDVADNVIIATSTAAIREISVCKIVNIFILILT